MSRPFGTAPNDLWTNAQALGWSDDSKLVVLFAMINPHNTSTGTYRLPDGYACEDLGWTVERFAQALANPSRNGYVNRCPDTKWVWIPDQLERHPLANPNQRTAARRQVQGIPPACTWRAAFFQRYGQHLGFSAEQIAQLCVTVPATVAATVPDGSAQPFANIESKSESEPELDLYAEQPAAVGTKRTSPRKAKPAGLTKPTLTAYVDAWAAVHGEQFVDATPAKTNSLLASFVKAVGPEEAPQIAAFYVQAKDRWLVEQRHPVEQLVSKASKWKADYHKAQGITASAGQAGTGWGGGL